jgi:hypothetical protein
MIAPLNLDEPESKVPATFAPVSVLNVPGIDRRRLDRKTMPFIYDMVKSGYLLEWDGHPTTEIWPTLVTGANPGKHFIWHCKLDDKGPSMSWKDRLFEMLPDRLVTTVQLFRHFANREFDMPCIPHRRRRHLEFYRLKFNARSEPHQYRNVGGAETVFAALGDGAAYGVTGNFDDFPAALEKWPRLDTRLDWFEIHAYDIASHYNVSNQEVMKLRDRQLDDFAKAYHDKCVAAGRRFVLVVDHGQEPVVGSVNLEKVVKKSGAKPSELVYFTAQGVAKFWFRSDSARKKVEATLRATPYLHIMDWQELNERFGFNLEKEWGELYAIADNGRVFFPHDFHHLLAHLHLGLTNPEMRSRLWNFNIAAYHGQMPGHPSELGFMVTSDDSIRPRVAEGEMIQVVDVATTLLSLVGARPLPHMEGKVVYENATHPITVGASVGV